MGKASRDKGAKGQSMATRLLRERDYIVDPISAGLKREDLIATAPEGKKYSVEVKNCRIISMTHRHQAITQARERKLLWMLMSKIAGTSAWLIQRQGCYPVIWHEKTQ